MLLKITLNTQEKGTRVKGDELTDGQKYGEDEENLHHERNSKTMVTEQQKFTGEASTNDKPCALLWLNRVHNR